MSQGTGPTTRRQTLDRLKKRYEWLQSFSDDELAQISYCNSSETMRQDEQYFDISQPERGIIRGEEGSEIPEQSCYVPRGETPRHLWDKLTANYT